MAGRPSSLFGIQQLLLVQCVVGWGLNACMHQACGIGGAFSRRSDMVTMLGVAVDLGDTSQLLADAWLDLRRNLAVHDRDVSESPQLGYAPCLLYTSPSPRDQRGSRMPSSA